MHNIIQIFKALSDETRLNILILISKRLICAKGIAKYLNISEAAVSQHLKVLKDAGIISGEKIGYFVLYNLQDDALYKVVEFTEELKKNELSNVHIHADCNSACKGSKNRCCQRNIEDIKMED